MNEIIRIDRPDQLVEVVRSASEQGVPIYPQGGGTCSDFGLPIRQPGWTIDLTPLNQIIDYPAADMTITVQAGIRMTDLRQILAGHQQQLPLDVPLAGDATLGGVLATNSSGPRRLGYGTARDYVIGIRAVDGRGVPFAGGGRVVKNVAGYDFCKLLIGSLGTLGVIREVTLKLRPLAAQRRAIVAAPGNVMQLEQILSQLVDLAAPPTALEWLVGPSWQAYATKHDWPPSADDVGWLALLLEGQPDEVRWLTQELERDWLHLPGLAMRGALSHEQSAALLDELTEFPASGGDQLVLQASLRPSRVVEFVQAIRRVSADASIEVHAGTGIVRFRLPEEPAQGLGHVLTGNWQPLAARDGGNLVIRSHSGRKELTRRMVWGTPSGPLALMQKIKSQFDPRNILNPGRFVYD